MINQNQLNLLYFGKRWDKGGECIIIGDNPLLSIKRFNSNELFQIIHYCQTENMHHTQNVWLNLCLKTIRDNFFPNMWFAIKRRMR